MRPARARERGATTVEFAIVSILLFMMLFGLIDLGIIAIGNTAGSNAAREGARVGMIDYQCADRRAGCTTDNYDQIVDAVEAKLGTLVAGTPSVDVRCIDGSTPDPTYPDSSKIACDANVERGTDLIEVKVTWTQAATSPFAKNATHTEVARMAIQGPPTDSSGGPGAPQCQVTGVASITPAVNSVSPAPVGHLTTPEQVTVVTNNDPSCDGIWADFPTANPDWLVALTKVGSGPDYTGTLPVTAPVVFNAGNNPQWVNILSADRNWILYNSASFTIDATAPTVTSCNPSQLSHSQSSVPFQVLGTGFVSPATVAITPAGFSIRSATFVNAGEIDIVVDTPNGNQKGAAYDVTVTNPDGSSGVKTGCLTVK